MRLCENCKIEEATLPRGTEFFCNNCVNAEYERLLPKPGVISYIMKLEERIERLEQIIQNRTADS